ncbi:MAG: restriction endonuclease subunit S [Bacteroidales bacterium]
MSKWIESVLGNHVLINNSVINRTSQWINYIDISSVSAGFYDDPTRMPLKDAPSRARRLLSNGDTVISTVRPYLKAYFFYKEGEPNTVASTGFAVLTPVSIDPGFLYYLTTNDQYIQYLTNNCTGSAYPAFNPEVIAQTKVFIPEDIKEQKSISSILLALDDKIQINLEMNQTLEEMAMTIYKEWFVDFGPFKDVRFVDSELGPIPKGWEIKNFFEIADLLSGGTPKTTVNEYWNGDIEWVSAKDIGSAQQLMITDTEKKITTLGLKNSSTKLLPANTVIVVARGSVGKFGMISKEMCMNQSCYGIYGKPGYDQPFIYLMTASIIEYLLRVAHGAIFDTITTSTFQAVKFALPPVERLMGFHELVNPLFQMIASNSFEIDTLKETRDYLLPKLISGEIRVKEANGQIMEVL